MSVKLEKLGAELAKARKKKTEWDSRVRDLERRYREEENSEIHDMVHAANLTPEQLAELLKMFADDAKAATANNSTANNDMNEEEPQNED